MLSRSLLLMSLATALAPSALGQDHFLVSGGQSWRSYDVLDTVSHLDPTGGVACADAPALPLPTMSGFAFTDELTGAAVVCGGEHESSGDYASECFRLVQGASEWEFVASMHVARHSGSAVQMPDRAFLIGGLQDYEIGETDTESDVVDVFYYDTGAVGAGPKLPQALYGTCATRVNDTHFSVTGGRGPTNAAVTASYLFDTAANAWTELPELLLPRMHHGCGMAGGELVVAGGVDRRDVHVFSFERNEWRVAQNSMPRDVGYGESLPYQDSFVVMHGTGYVDGDLSLYNRDIWLYVAETESWQSIGSTEGMTGAMASVVDNAFTQCS